MKYLLDTNACIDHLNNRKSSVATRLSKVMAEDVVLCSVVKAELYFRRNCTSAPPGAGIRMSPA